MVNELPENWLLVSLSEVAYIQMGQSPNSRTYNEIGDGLPFFQGKAEFGKIHPKVKKWTTDPIKIAEANDILLSVRAPVGPTNLATEKCCLGRGLASIRAYSPLNNKYLFYYFRNIEPWLRQQGTGTTFTGVNSDFIQNLQVPIAPINEQQRIAEKLDTLLARVDTCLARLERVLGILEQFRQAVLVAATSGDLTANWREGNGVGEETQRKFDFSDAGCFGDYSFPSCWEALRLNDIAEITTGIMKSSKKQDSTYEEIPYLRVANVQRGYFDLSEVKTILAPTSRIEGLLLKQGDILFNEGGDLDKLGRGWVWAGEIDRCIFQNHVFRARLYDTDFNPKFFSYYGNVRGIEYFSTYGKQTTNLASISKSVLEDLPVVVPPPEEQDEIVGRVESMFILVDHIEAKCNAMRAQIEQLSPIFLDKAFRGELVPQDPNDEPVSTLLESIRTARASMPPETRKPRRRPKMQPKSSPEPIGIVEALREAQQELSSYDLFAAAGYPAEAESEAVETFFVALRDALRNGQIAKVRRNDTDWFSLTGKEDIGHED